MKHVITTLVFVFLCSLTVAQDKASDRILMLDGEERIGKVTEINEDEVKFVYSGETLVYVIKKESINKIQFASGRIEVITEVKKGDDGTQVGSSLEAHHNVVAVLPFSFLGQGGDRDSKMGMKVQSDCYTLLKKSASQFTIQDPITTNAVLIKNNINENNVAGLTPSEIANLLGVEYVIYGAVKLDQTGSTTSSGAYGTSKNKGNKNIGVILGLSSYFCGIQNQCGHEDL
ncbi:MAG: hypothetical protein U5K54_00140 [Cytophagales bacterium]|nr:hypothetical protein [Cytophagales bacterium]